MMPLGKPDRFARRLPAWSTDSVRKARANAARLAAAMALPYGESLQPQPSSTANDRPGFKCTRSDAALAMSVAKPCGIERRAADEPAVDVRLGAMYAATFSVFMLPP